MQRRSHKKKKTPEAPITRVRLPHEDEGEMFGIVAQLHGSNQIRIACADGQERMCRIPGKMRKRVWMRQNDLVIVKLWDFQPSKADVVWRFLGNQVEWLRRNGHLEGLSI
ncbi:MAG: translation initiation factor eIF-1A [Candidatus Diapherotrites archaeon]|uniref:Translation initiation factor 1A n=1 Tax=Candidatus Iainarchaeum sp. TaxID=3101447 RepID=A0A2D6M1D4_9ARCH|nr:translation initiation factor eIF-1A [Candidatus Diapherotrites archaeon]|tara:strand:- start:3016 stop:3345 length:330 start_codon:yes stop_codon:yes gene_type:complete